MPDVGSAGQRSWWGSLRAAGAPGRVDHRVGAGAGAVDTGICRRANNCTGNRTGALTSAGNEWRPAGCTGRVFEAISELEFDQTANLAVEAGRDQWAHLAGADA